MKLKQIKFNNFKTIKGRMLDIEEDITCLVGINESGKSNVLIGLEKCDIDSSISVDDISRHSEDYLRDGANPPSIEMEFIVEDQEVEELNEIFGRNDVRVLRIAKSGSDYRIDYPAINYQESVLRFEDEEDGGEKDEEEGLSTEEASEQIEESTTEEETDGINEAAEGEEEGSHEPSDEEIRQKVVQAVNKLLPRFRFFNSVDFESYYLPEDGDVSIPELITNPDQHAPVINLLKLAGIKPQDLSQHGTPEQKTRRDTRLSNGTDKLNEKLLRAFWPIKTVNLSLGAEGDTLKIHIRENQLFLPKERSSGLQWALAFNIFFLASADSELENTILLIDEPGIFLHIEGQRKMLSSTFPQIVDNGNQIIYTTHLPYLIDKHCPERIRILEKESEDTKIGNKAWSESEFGSIPEPVRTAIGLNIEEAFLFGERNVVVEGPADQIYLRTIIEKFDPDLLDEITIIPAYGIEKIPKVIALAVLSGKVAHGVIDSDVDLNEIENLKKVLDDGKIEVKKLSQLISNNKIKTIEDVLPATLFIQAVCNVYRKEFEKRNWKFDCSQVNSKKPRVIELEGYFKTKLNSPKHKLLKMDIARNYMEIVRDGGLAEKSSEWKDAEALANSLKEFIGLGNESDAA